MSWTRIRLEPEGKVLAITLARPEVHDAFDDVTIKEITQAFEGLEAERADHGVDTRVVLIRSTGRSFCAGADVEWMRRVARQSRQQNLQDAEALEGMFAAIATCPRPVVARVHGAALGGGAGLVAACDIAVASTEAKLGFTEVRLGILPAVISPYVLRKVAPGVAQSLFLTGEIIPAARGYDLGLLHRVVPPPDLDGAVDAVIANLLAGAPSAQAEVKRLVGDVAGVDPPVAKRRTTLAITDARAGDEGREGLSAFLEKRKPRWAPDPEG